MSDFALVIYPEQKQEELPEGKFGKYFEGLMEIMHSMLKISEPEEEFEAVELYDNLKAYLIELPFNPVDTGKSCNSSKIGRFISKACAKVNMANCILPRGIPEICGFDGGIRNSFTGRYLYKALLISILDEIYTKRGTKISELDIAIVEGESGDELFSIITSLTPLVKYLTVLVNDNEAVEREINRIYTDTGLSVMMTGNLKSGCKNADLIINLGGIREAISGIKPKAVVLNYDNSGACNILGEYVLINGIEVSLPEETLARIGGLACKHFSKLELAEIILSHRVNMEDKIIANCMDFESMSGLSREFKKTGCRVTGFKGRHNIFKAEDIKNKI